MQAPFWSQGLNRYSYVFNNPINATDPSGFSSEPNSGAITAGFAAAAPFAAVLSQTSTGFGLGNVTGGALAGRGAYGLWKGPPGTTTSTSRATPTGSAPRAGNTLNATTGSQAGGGSSGPAVESVSVASDEQVKKFLWVIAREEFALQMPARTKYAIDALQPGTQAKVLLFHEDARRLIFKRYPGWEFAANGSARAFSDEILRGKNPQAPFMHFSRLAIDFQPIIGGRMVTINELNSDAFAAYNADIAGVALRNELEPGVRFGHPEHFEDRRGQPYTRALQDMAESGDFGIIPKRDVTGSDIQSGGGGS